MTEHRSVGPLESLHSERVNPQSGLVEKLPLLHSSLCADISFLPYLPLANHRGDGCHGEPDTLWVEALQELDSDLHWLLTLPHAHFWSQVVYDNSLQKCLDSYLRNAQRSYDRPFDLPLKVKEVQRNVHKRMFMTFLRMSSTKESETSYLSPSAHCELIYENYLFDIPKLMDLCVLYSPANKALLSEMVDNVFKVQPKYQEDWSLTVLSLTELLQKVSDKVLPKQGAVLLHDQHERLGPGDLTDLILYLGDIAATLMCFLDVYPPAVSGLLQAEFLESLITFYESVVPVLQKQWLAVSRTVTNAQHVKTVFRQFKKDIACVVDRILHVYLSPDSSHISLDSFISAVTTVFTEKSFLREFEKHFSLSRVFREMQQTHHQLPESHFDYIISSLDGQTTDVGRQRPPPASLSDSVSHVKELLPHLGEDFIEICLKEFGNNPETVVNRVLEDNLPEHLKHANKNPFVDDDVRKRSSQPKATTALVTGKGLSTEKVKSDFVEHRANVFDHDNFDVFRRGGNVDLTKVHIGKKLDVTPAMLDDKTHLAQTRDSYRQYENENPWSYADIEGDGMPGMSRMSGMQADVYEFDQYSDEYDDTYDSHLIGAADNDNSEEMFTVRRLNDKGQYVRRFSESPEHDDPSPNHVTSNPSHVTILKRSSKDEQQFSKSKSKTTIGTSPHKSQSSKGQGSKGHEGSAKTVDGERARQLKDRNKAKRANHSRKAMADKKRDKGMMGGRQ